MNIEKGKMREILFRGKRIDNGEWIHGFLVIYGDDYYIAPDINAYTSMGGRGKGRCMLFGHYYQVISETVGQFAGLIDKNGKKIFEGDIVEFPDRGNGGTKMGQVQYDDVETLYEIIYEENICIPLGESFHGFELEVIGNIHDTPELLKDKS